MGTPQMGIFQEGSATFYYLEYRLKSNGSGKEISQALRASLQGEDQASINMVVAFGKHAWTRLNPKWEPSGFTNFQELKGTNGHHIPSTQRDILFWLHSSRHDLNFAQALQIQSHMAPIAELKLDLSGFQYRDSRDLIGFIDGTANPKEEKARLAALIPEDQLGAGGSFVLSQQWVHNLPAFNQLSQTEQEQVVGRTKPDSIELEGAAMPATSHVSRADFKENGKALKIYRRSAPYGTVREHGLYFLAFACELRRFQVLLERMFGVSGDRLSDKLIEYSKPVTSSYWFAPSQEDLEKIFS